MDISAVMPGMDATTVPSAGPARTQWAAREFEAMFVQMLLQSSGIGKLAEGDASSGVVWDGLVVQGLARQIAAGQGLGFGQMIMNAMGATEGNNVK